MNDFYLKLANTTLGNNLLGALNLPKPVSLKRSPQNSPNTLNGRVLIGGHKNNFALKQIPELLAHQPVDLCVLDHSEETVKPLDLSKYRTLNGPVTCLSNEQLKKFRLDAVIYDAFNIRKIAELSGLYDFFHPVVRQIKSGGRVIVLGLLPEQTASPEAAAAQGALGGFVRSLAKELGKKGITVQLLYTSSKTGNQLTAPLKFLLSEKSAFITGQTLTVCKAKSPERGFDWHKPLKNKLALVTGAAQGIGETTARALARDGAKVACLDIPQNQKLTEKLADEINGYAISLDLSEKNAPKELLAQIGAHFGVIDIIIHNAGITRDKTLANMPLHFWDQVININLDTISQINKLLLDNGAINKRGRIVCVSSIAGIAGNYGQTNYAASKAGIISYVQSMARELGGSDLTINAVAPGFIETRLTAQIPLLVREAGRRMSSLSQGGLPIDVAEAIAFFSSPAAQGLNGQTLRVCGQNLLGK